MFVLLLFVVEEHTWSAQSTDLSYITKTFRMSWNSGLIIVVAPDLTHVPVAERVQRPAVKLKANKQVESI